MHTSRLVRSRSSRAGAIALVAGLIAALSTPTHAYQFTKGELKASFDSTLSFGGMYRLQNPDPMFYGRSNTFNGVPGQQNSVNSDDGNLNYGKGWVSQLAKGSHDLELKYRNFGALVRGYWFYDFKSDDTLRTPLSDQAKDRVVRGGDFLDMYVRGSFEVFGGTPLELRFGRQVLSLGESTFIPNGVNIVNPADLSKLRTPGSEVKEALLPVNMLKASIGVTENITIEPFWLLEFRRNELEPAGTYFSTNDFASRGGDTVWLRFGGVADKAGNLGGIYRTYDRDASNFNQYGVATRIMVPELQDTEFGFYFARYNSRSPVVSAFMPTSPAAPFVQSIASTLAQQTLVPQMIAAGFPAANIPTVLPTLLGAALTGVPASALPASIQPFYPTAAGIAAQARPAGLLTAAATGRYFNEYPEGLNMFGASFNTSLGKTGISWQGEVTHKQNVPLQVDDVELLFAALAPLAPQFHQNNQLIPPTQPVALGNEISGYRRHKVWTAQSTMTKVFGPMLGAQQFTVLGEVGGVWVNLPSKDVLRYDGPGSFTSGSATQMTNTGFSEPATPASAFADKFSWGYQVLGRLEYSNLIPNITVLPTVAFTHDVKGNTPLPLGNFLEDRKSITISAEFVYRNAWSLDVRYVNYFGASRYNLLSDRDFVATTIKYSF